MRFDDRDRRWDALERAVHEVVRRFAGHGVVGVEYVVGFPEMPVVGVWLVVGSDRERDTLSVYANESEVRGSRSDQRRLSDELTGELAVIPRAEAGDLEEVTGVVQSQQTVDRDFEGNRFYAMR